MRLAIVGLLAVILTAACSTRWSASSNFRSVCDAFVSFWALCSSHELRSAYGHFRMVGVGKNANTMKLQ